jgi:hypothetical protein
MKFKFRALRKLRLGNARRENDIRSDVLHRESQDLCRKSIQEVKSLGHDT